MVREREFVDTYWSLAQIAEIATPDFDLTKASRFLGDIFMFART